MKQLLIIVLFLFSTGIFSQKRMVLIPGFQGHKIEVSDSLTEGTVKEFYHWANKSRVDYETKLTELKAIYTIGSNKNVLHSRRDSVIYINSYADQFPYSKRVLIMHELGLFYDAKPIKGSGLHVMNENFYLTPKYEKNYKYRKSHFTDMKALMKTLEKSSPLKTK